jgi:hypothetical protein
VARRERGIYVSFSLEDIKADTALHDITTDGPNTGVHIFK